MSPTPLTTDDTLALVDPNAPEDVQQQQAQVLADGSRANAAYWNSRGDMEQVMAQVNGHGNIPSFTDLNTEAIDAGDDPQAIDGTAEEDGTSLPAGSSEDPQAAQIAGAPDPTNETEAVAKLREQVQSLGGTPEA